MLVPRVPGRCRRRKVQRTPNRYIIGITCDPLNRWRDAPYAYKRRGYLDMTIVGVCYDPESIAELERTLIQRFRTSDPRGLRVNPSGDAHCMNKNPGGEGARVNSSGMCFLYISRKI
jgi:hypothetical protein